MTAEFELPQMEAAARASAVIRPFSIQAGLVNGDAIELEGFIERAIRAAEAQARREALMEAARAECVWCREYGIPPAIDICVHVLPDGRRRACQTLATRALLAAEEQEP